MGPVSGDRFEVDTSSARPAPKPCPVRNTKRTAFNTWAGVHLTGSLAPMLLVWEVHPSKF